MTPAVSEKVTNNYFNLFAEKASGICHPSRAEKNAIIVQSHYGTIFSPDYPVPYQNDTTCVWRLYAADGDRVRLRFVDFELGQSVFNTKYSFCDLKSGMDYVEIRDGESSTDKRLSSYCGKKTPFDVYSSGRRMLIKFRANRDGVQAYRGFKAHFESVKERKFASRFTSIIYSPTSRKRPSKMPSLGSSLWEGGRRSRQLTPHWLRFLRH